jgi:hypothetical protein
MPAEALTRKILCDGCGRPATAEHIRDRLARLEWATRFRPIHINVLLLISSPPLEADFYDASVEDSGGRSLEDVLFGAFGIAASETGSGAATPREARLSEFQRLGIFLVPVCECPLDALEIPGAIERLGPTIAKRIRFSYKPKAIVLLSPELANLNAQLAAEGQGMRVLDAGNALTRAARGDAAAGAELRAIVSKALQA